MTAGRNSLHLKRASRSSPGCIVMWSTAAVLMLGGCADSTSRSNTTLAVDTSADARFSDSTTRNESRSANTTVLSRSAATTASSAASRDRCIVASVTDGDSMRCTDRRRIRLLLLDSPEMSQTPFGAQSRDALRARIKRGDTVWLEYDVQREDQYGRTLAHVWTARDGGTHINLAQAADGWAVAVVFQPNVAHIEAIRRAVATARQQKRGLWADGRYTCEPIAHKRGNC